MPARVTSRPYGLELRYVLQRLGAAVHAIWPLGRALRPQHPRAMMPIPALPDATAVRRIACVMVSGVGDVICVTPALAALKERYPAASITVIMRPHLRDLIEGNPHVADAMFFDTSSLRRCVDLCRALRRRRFDLWVDLHVPTFNTVRSNHKDFLRNALLLLAAGARYRLGYAAPMLRPWLTHRVALPAHAVQCSTNIVDTTLALAAPAAGRRYRKHVPVDDHDRKHAASLLPASDARRIALYFGSRQAADIWPDAHVMAFIDLLVSTWPDFELVLIGGEYEADFAQRVESFLGRRPGMQVHNLIGRCSLAQTAAVLARCTLFVSTDSGPLHIADAVGVPLVALFASKNYLDIWRPVDTRCIVINHPVPCGPCLKAVCPIGNRCMDLITPDEVVAAVAALLATLPAADLPTP